MTFPPQDSLEWPRLAASGLILQAALAVRGTPITQFCDMKTLTVRARLGLFLEVLAAVETGHSQLVLHRDLRPSNILVTAEGRVVIMAARDASTGPLLDYAAPEALLRQPLGIGADIYSLGVLLYELLTGLRPFGAEGESRRAIEETVLKLEPLPPSHAHLTLESAAARGTTVRKLARTLRGDLDAIVLKALRKSPIQRYRWAGVLAEDLRASLRKKGLKGRVRRLIARHG